MTRPADVGCPPPHPSPRVPRLRLPDGAVDAHCHVFGPAHLFPFAPDRTFTPPDVSKDDLRRRHDHLGLGCGLIVQAACHGTDHSALLNALRAGQGRYRGVAIVTPAMWPEKIARLHEAGVRGARLNFMPHLGQSPGPATTRVISELVGPFSWHIGVHVAGTGVADLEDEIRAIEPPVVIDHMARVDLRDGLDSEPVRALKRLLDTGGVWVKLSAADRLSLEGPPYRDAVALARALAEHAPERVLWGTDFPHPNIRGDAPDDGLLVDLLEELAPSADLRRRILVDNPAELLGHT